ncbi:MAG: 16S rRNA processing protein RimM [Bradymonadia bacterium]|jgi:16S rRNA processing protein RimM
MRTDEDPNWVEWAKCGKPHGLKGEVRLFLHNPQSNSVAQVDEVRLILADGTEQETELTAFRAGPKFGIARFAAAPGRNEAETLTNARVFVPDEVFPDLDEDEWYAFELEGLDALDTATKAKIGVVQNLVDFGAGDLLEIRVKGQNVFVPFAAPYIGAIDLQAGTVEVEANDFLT